MTRLALKPPWWFCCGWWSPWCLIDTVLHELHIEWRWVCDKHDAVITGETKNWTWPVQPTNQESSNG